MVGEPTAPGRERADGAPDGRRLRWTEHRAQRRTSFVVAGAAAIEWFGPNASAEQIAEVAGVSRTVLYRYRTGDHRRRVEGFGAAPFEVLTTLPEGAD